MPQSQDDALESKKPPRRRIPKALVIEACREDDVSKVQNVIELAQSPDTRITVQDILEHAVRVAITKNADKVLSYALTEGGPIPKQSHLPSEGLPSLQILDILVAHGWDINAYSRGQKPFLWQAVADHDLVIWALDHGADVQPRDQESYKDNDPLRDHTDCPPILEEAVRYCCQPSTFDLLRSKGAPITRRVLHLAVEKADSENESSHERRLTLVRHLLDKYNLDVNAFDGPGNMGNHWGTPLCYVAHNGPKSDCKEVVELLLQRGADPDLCASDGMSAIAMAERSNNTQFLEAISVWRDGNAEDSN